MIANERAENLLCVLRSKNRFIKLFTLVTSNAFEAHRHAANTFFVLMKWILIL